MSIKPFNEQVGTNPLRTKVQCEQALIDILEPAMELMAESNRYGRFRMSDSGAVYSQDRTSIEGFCRLLWGLGPLFSNADNIRRFGHWWQLTCEGIIRGTTPSDPDYWGGDLGDYDQLFVEMGAISAFLFETQEQFWDHLSDLQQSNILVWLEQVNHKVLPQTNWLWFRQLVNSWFVATGHPEHEPLIQADFDIVSSHYLDHGWSYDGYENQIDNYIPFAYQFFTLVMAGLTNGGGKRDAILKTRATAFVKSYANWFAADGACLAFGRSLDYRFAQAAFWGAAAFAGVEPPQGWGIADFKHMLLGNLRWWFKQHIFQSDGLIPIGYAYPNMNMAEGYNGPASAYWALKTFIFLCIPDDDPFWTVREAEDFKFESLKRQPEPRMLVAHSRHGMEVQAFTAGQHSHEHAHADAKYEKYVYSTTFGFSVPKSTTLLKQLACDNTLAVAQSDYHWQSAYGYEDYAIHDDYVYSLWKPWQDVSIRNFIVPCMPWHVRVHVIDSGQTLHLAEGGFSLPDITPENHGHTVTSVAPSSAPSTVMPDARIDGTSSRMTSPIGNAIDSPSVFYQTAQGLSGLVAAKGFYVELSSPEPNVNLLYPKTRIPLQTRTIEPGHYVFVSLYLGDRESESLNSRGQVEIPSAALCDRHLFIGHHRQEMDIRLQEYPHAEW